MATDLALFDTVATRDYWLDLFSGTTWQEFLDAGSTVTGFRASRWSRMQRIKVGDYLLCYLTGVSRFVGVLEVTSAPYKDTSQIWKDEDFPCRLKVRPITTLTPATGIPILDLQGQLSFLQNMDSP